MSFTIDSSLIQKTIVSYGSPVLSANVSKFGGKSLYCDGSSYIAAQSPTDFVFRTGDFTVECWFYATTLPTGNAERAILTTADPSDFNGFLLELRNSNIRWLIGNGSSWNLDRIVSGTTIAANTWYHIALTRTSGTARVFLNGQLIDSASNTTDMPNINNAIRIGGRSIGNQYFVGYIDEVRVTKGIGGCRYTNNFNVPLLPFASVGSPIIPPELPTALQAIAGDQRITATWVEPLEDNGSEVIDYHIQYSDNQGSSWTTVDKLPSYDTNVVVTGLINDTSYDLRVASVNIAGTGNYVLQTGVMPFTEPLDTTPDPYFYNTSLLLHANGEDNDTVFVDDSPYPKTISVNGNARIRVLQAKFGGGSAYFDGSGDYLTMPSNVANFGLDDFTVECWIYPIVWNNGALIIGGSSNNMLQFGRYSTSNNLGVALLGVTWLINDAALPPTETWTHVAVTRQSGVMKIWINGTQSGSTYDDNTLDFSAAANRIGGNGSSDFNGYIDDIRITKGVARYTANFNVPTLAFSNVAPTAVPPSAPTNLSLDNNDSSIDLSWTPPTNDGYDRISYVIESATNSQNPTWATQTSATSLLLHCNLGDISYQDTFKDYSAYNHRILWNSNTGSGPASIATEYYDNNYGYNVVPQKIGNGCLSIAATNSYSPSYVLKVDEHSSLNPGTGNYTMEMWVYNQHVWNQYYGKNTARLFGSYVAASGSYFGISHHGSYGYNMRIAKYVNGTDQGSSYYVDLPYAENNRWNHLAFSRDNGTLRIFVNGTKKIEVSDATNDIFAAGGMVLGGGDSQTSNYMFGKLDEVRFTNGKALYTANFDFPPETEFYNATIHNLVNDTNYIFRVKATNSAGDSDYTANSSEIAPIAPPVITITTQPVNTLTSDGSTAVTFSTVATTDDNSAISYQWFTYDEYYNGYETIGGWEPISNATSSSVDRAVNSWSSDYYGGYMSQPDFRVYAVLSAGKAKKKTDIVRLWVEPPYYYPSSNFYPYFNTSGNETVNSVVYTVGQAGAGSTADFEIYSNTYYYSPYSAWYTGNDMTFTIEKSADGTTWTNHSTSSLRAYDNYYLYGSIDGSSFTSGDVIYFRVSLTSIWPLTVSNNTGFSTATPQPYNVANLKISWT